MLKNYIKTAWRNLMNNKLYSALNVIGLTAYMKIYRMKFISCARILLIQLYLLLITGYTASAQVNTDSLNILLNDLGQDYIKDPQAVGLSIGVYHNGKTCFYNFGTCEKDKQQVPTKNTIYEIGSVTKTFTGTLLSYAVYDHKISFDDDIRKYIEGNYPNLQYQGHPVTILNLVNHTSGLPYFFPDKPDLLNTKDYDTLIANIAAAQEHYSRQDFFNDLHKATLDTIPGFRSNYSNVAVQLLGYMLESIYKMPYEKLIQQYISVPLKMKNTGISYSGIQQAAVARGYNGKGIQMPYMQPVAGAAGGLHATVNDMVHYIKFQLDEKNEVVELSHKITWGNINDYAIGVFWDENKTPDGTRRLVHSGGTYGFSSYCVIYPESNTGIVLLSNEADPGAQGRLEEMANKIFSGLNSMALPK